ncbi:hypothetical protein ABI59_00960 [Acidobacteria bacterium Mor1]|nr:hypothetical protein ABI59_00960 [Acidobacteria bacterium Mor1]
MPSRSDTQVLVILGSHRSGTSLLTHLLSRLGVRLGDDLLEADDWNAGGYFERRDLLDLHEELQRRLDRGWNGPHVGLPYPENWPTRDSLGSLRSRLSGILERELAGGGLFGFKDPRTASLLPMWDSIFSAAGATPQFILALRHPAAVVRSLERRNGLPPAHGEALWLRTYLDALEFAGERIGCTVDYDHWFQNANGTAERVAAFARELEAPGAAQAETAISEVLRGDLRHHRSDDPAGLSPATLELYELLSRGPLTPATLAAAAELRNDRRVWERLVAPVELAPSRSASHSAAKRDAAGRGSVAIEPLPVPEASTPRGKRRICIVSTEFIGPYKNGGIGTASTTLGESLAAAGHQVTLLYAKDRCENQNFEYWIRHFDDKQIEFVPLPMPAYPVVGGSVGVTLPYHVYSWLRENDRFDAIHFHEMCGIGYYAQLAKRQGTAFAGTTMIVGTHSPHEWIRHANQTWITDPCELQRDYAEQQSVAMADVLWGPSRYLLSWLRDRDWEMPETCHVRQYILPTAARQATAPDRSSRPVREAVFFGRLETRKGLAMFCNAVDELARDGVTELAVTFLGRHARVGSKDSARYIAERSADWPFEVKILSDLDQPQAIAYLLGEGRMGVIASPIDNSPNTVYECLGAGIPFIACRAGGVPELIHPEDAEEICFDYRGHLIAERIAHALEAGIRPARPAVPFEENEQAWLDWHAALPAREESSEPSGIEATVVSPLVTVCLPHHNRPEYLEQAIQSIRDQDYPDIELVLVDDGSWQEDAKACLNALEPEFRERSWRIVRQENRYLGAARNAAVAHARGEYLLFLDDDNYAKPQAIRRLVEVARHTGADALTCFRDLFRGDGPPDFDARPPERSVFVGAAPSAGLFHNVFGDAFSLVRRDAFDAVGGFTEDYGITHEDWELFMRMVLAGRRLQVVPEALYWYRIGEDHTSITTSYYRNCERHIRPLLEQLPPALHGILPTAQSLELHRVELNSALGLSNHLLLSWLKQMMGTAQRIAAAGEGTGAREIVNQGLEVARRAGDDGLQTDALLTAAAVELQLGQPRPAARYAGEAREIAARAGLGPEQEKAAAMLTALERLNRVAAQGSAAG